VTFDAAQRLLDLKNAGLDLAQLAFDARSKRRSLAFDFAGNHAATREN
jgi:hypothetical protein